MKSDDIRDLVGCSVDTSYGTGGEVVYVSDYYDGINKDRFTINYIDSRDGHRCIINGIRWEPEKEAFMRYNTDYIYFSGTPKPRQLTLF